MTENRDEFRNPYALDTAASVEVQHINGTITLPERVSVERAIAATQHIVELLRRKGGLPSKAEDPRGASLKKNDDDLGSVHSTTSKNNAQELEDKTKPQEQSISSGENSALKNALEMLGVNDADTFLTEAPK